MGRLTDDMTRLRSDIDSSHDQRRANQSARNHSVRALLSDFAKTRAFNASKDARQRAQAVADNRHDVSRLLNDFSRTRQANSRKSRAERRAFVSGVKRNTQQLLTKFAVDHKNMARRSVTARADFVSDMANSVAALISEITQDRLHAHQVFFDAGVSKKNAIGALSTLHFEPAIPQQLLMEQQAPERDLPAEPEKSVKPADTALVDIYKTSKKTEKTLTIVSH
jgi:hypothetical protein